jgi:hypothetical protein
MPSRRLRPLFTAALLLAFSASLALFAQDTTTTHRGRKYKAPPPTSRVEVTILRGDDGKPIENAAVVFQLEGDKGNMELKTNEDGKAVIDVLPQGSKVLVQVLAKGFQTYGKDYTIDKPEMALEVKMNRPGKQYSIYENQPQAAKQDDGAGKDKQPDAAKDDGSKDSSKKDQPSESADDSGSKPASSQPQPQ